MKDQIISFETAKLAKEKGFDIPCSNYYAIRPTGDQELINTSGFKADWNGSYTDFNAPTQSLLQKWLRDIYDIWVTVDTWKFVLRNKDHTIQYRILCDDNLIPRTEFGKEMIDGFGDTYEEALERGLRQALKLINMEKDNE